MVSTLDENVVLSSIVKALGRDAKLYQVAVLREGEDLWCGIERNGMQGLRCEIQAVVDEGDVYIRIGGQWKDVSFDSVCAGMG